MYSAIVYTGEVTTKYMDVQWQESYDRCKKLNFRRYSEVYTRNVNLALIINFKSEWCE